jgi:hypothetical protein
MPKNTEKTPGTPASNPKIEYLGWSGFALMLVKVFAITGVIVLILKYILKVPLF